jgi:hypothetical protein
LQTQQDNVAVHMNGTIEVIEPNATALEMTG